MKTMKMQKWWMACILALLVLLATGAALAADTVIFRDCAICGQTTQFVRVRYGGNYYINNVPSHVGYYKCSLGHGDELAYLDDHVPHSGGTATCTEQAKCQVCGTAYGALEPHDREAHDAKAPTCTEIGWGVYDTCKNCDYTTRVDIPATGHSYLNTVTQPTCTKGGYTTHTCTVCSYSFTNRETAALGHWYGDWTPETDGTHTADCRRSGCRYQNAVACAAVACKLTADDQTVKEFTLCPVCGEIDGGASLARVEKAAAQAVNKNSVLPAGELTLRMGAPENGAALMSVCFERGGSMTQPAGKIKITLPAELLTGYTLSLLNADGSQTPLTVGTDGASFTLDFTDAETPVMLIRLVSAA